MANENDLVKLCSSVDADKEHMPRRQSHRGPAPKDERLFNGRQLPALRSAAHDLCWLLDHGYSSHSAIELVGNRYNLVSRQRMAVSRCASSIEAARQRHEREIATEQVRGRELWIDGYNLLTVLESALAGGVVLLGRDGCCRDIAGIHRRYRKVNETEPVLRMIGETAAEWGVTCCRWWLDKPVSNSGRLKAFIQEVAANAGWNTTVELVFNPDKVLRESEHVIATSDGAVLDRCRQWVNLARYIIASRIAKARVIDLSLSAEKKKDAQI